MRRALAAWCIVLVGSTLAACSPARPDDTVVRSSPAATIDPAPSPEPTDATGEGDGDVAAEDFDPARFDETSIDVDNRWLPLRPGTQYVYEGRAFDEGELIERRVVFTVTDLVKEIAGVRTVVMWDQDFNDGGLVEAELAFFAQDTDGHVWHLGQYPEEYEDGELDKAPAWLHGIEGATAGIAMRAEPHVGSSDYAQGFAPPPIDWDDRARVWKVGRRTCVPVDCFDDVLITEEFEPGIPGAFQLKFYAPGVGNVRVGWRGPNEEEREVLRLVELVELSRAEIREVRRAALRLEKRAYRIKGRVFHATPPAEPR